MRPYIAFHIMISGSLFAGLLSFMSSLTGARSAILKRNAIANLKLTEGLITELDRDGDGVDKLEFLIGMLAQLDLAYWHDVKPLLDLFDKFDKDHSGMLNKTDVLLALAGGDGHRVRGCYP